MVLGLKDGGTPYANGRIWGPKSRGQIVQVE